MTDKPSQTDAPTASEYREQILHLMRNGDLDKALAVAELGLTHRRYNERLWQAKLNLLRKLRRFEEAFALANDTGKLTTKARATPYFHKLAFDTYMDAGDVDGARERLDLLAGLNPGKGPQYMACLVRLAAETGDVASTLDELRLRFDDIAEKGGLSLSVAELFEAAGQGDVAVALLRQAVAHDPSEQVLAGLARLLRRLEDEPAIADLLDDHPEAVDGSSSLMAIRLSAYEAMEEADAGLTVAEKAVVEHPASAPLHRLHWALLDASKGRESVKTVIDQRLAASDTAENVKVASAEFLFDRSETEAGLNLLRVATQSAPTSAVLALRLAAAELEHGFDPAAALDCIEKAEATGLEPATFATVKATALGRFGLLPEAIALLRGLDEQGHLERAGQFRLTAFLVLTGQFDEALEVLTTIDADTPGAQASRAQWRAEIAMHRGDLSLARRQLLRSIALMGEDGADLGLLARLQILAGDYDAAWNNHVRDCAARERRNPGMRVRPTQTLLGHLLNEFRIQYGAREGYGLRWHDPEPAAARRWFCTNLEEEPGSTPAAIGLLGALRREGRITVNAPGLGGGDLRIPRQIGHYWDAPEPPDQVQGLLDWNRALNPDYDFVCFNDRDAQNYLLDHGERPALQAYRLTRYAAARSDLFRLAWLWHEGGIWLDADDRCRVPYGEFIDHRLRFVGYQEHYWTVGNNFMAVGPRDPIIRDALDEATEALAGSPGAPVWLSSGPGAISRALARHGTDAKGNLNPDIWIMPVHALIPRIAQHVRLNYKGTDSHWVRQMRQPAG